MAHITAHRQGTVCHLDLVARSMHDAQAFYGGLLGWTFRDEAPDGTYAIALLGDDPVAAIGEHPEEGQNPRWHVYFAQDDVDAATERACDLGAERVEGPTTYDGMGRMAVLRDPTGVSFSLWQADGFVGATRLGEPGALAWQELNTRDADTAVAFYTQLLQATARPLPRMPYHTLHHADDPFAGILQMDEHWPDDAPSCWQVYFAVSDTDAACAQVQALGGAVHVPPFDTTHGRIAVVSDPDGAVFSLIDLTTTSG